MLLARLVNLSGVLSKINIKFEQVIVLQSITSFMKHL
jgi:hypothetical protein